MLNFQEFFTACAGRWSTERTYHYLTTGQIERSHTEFRADVLTTVERQQILTTAIAPDQPDSLRLEAEQIQACPGFAISFETRSETGEEVAMSLKALFVPEQLLPSGLALEPAPPLPPIAAQVLPSSDVIQGYYLRDQGYSESGAIAGRFTYQASRHTLEMTTYYRRSVAVDQMRLLDPQVRLRTITTYQRPQDDPHQTPSMISLIGFGVERKQA